MTTELAKTETQLPAIGGDDPYLKTAARVGSDRAFLKFVKGAFFFGIDEEELPAGTEVVPNMTEAQIGWLKWADGEVVEERMFPWAAGHPFREDLGDMDRDQWDTDDNGKAMDPWTETATMPFKDPATGQEFTFTTSSGGGRRALSKLVYAWRHGATQGKSGLPVVALGADSYKHKKYGRVEFPTFKIVRWADEADLMTGTTTDPVDELNDELPPGF